MESLEKEEPREDTQKGKSRREAKLRLRSVVFGTFRFLPFKLPNVWYLFTTCLENKPTVSGSSRCFHFYFFSFLCLFFSFIHHSIDAFQTCESHGKYFPSLPAHYSVGILFRPGLISVPSGHLRCCPLGHVETNELVPEPRLTAWYHFCPSGFSERAESYVQWSGLRGMSVERGRCWRRQERRKGEQGRRGGQERREGGKEGREGGHETEA